MASKPSPDPSFPSRRRPSAPRLWERVRLGAENRPGIYRFVGPRGEILYVGKSVRIRTRLLSYFRDGTRGKARELLRVAEEVEWEYVPNEFEALLREFRQIRAFRPRFNVRHRRERRFAWVKITGEAAPRLVATRKPRADGGRYFGPFPAPRNLPATLRDLARAVGLRDCPAATPLHFADQLDLLGPERTPLCPRAELETCPGPCAGLCSETDYRENVRRAVAFLDGRDDVPLARLRSRMEDAGRSREFEHAARLRDRLEALERLQEAIAQFRDFLTGLTFVYRVPAGASPAPEEERGYLVLGGRVRITFSLPSTSAGSGASGSEGIRAVEAAIRRVRDEPPAAPEALTPAEWEELFLVARWFRDNPRELERTEAPEAFLRPGSSPSSGSARTRPSARAEPTGGPA
jgi:excinuclease ABC subunit C